MAAAAARGLLNEPGSTSEAVDSTDDGAVDLRAATPSPRAPLRGEGPRDDARLASPRRGPKEAGPRRTEERHLARLAREQEKQTRFAHQLVPRRVDLAKEYSKEEGSITTVMARNIPSNYAQRDLMEDLADLGLSGTFDFLYIPLDKNTMTNVGYAFVNFLDPRYAAQCMTVLQGFRFKRNRRDRGRLAAASPAHIQGLEANMRHYEKAVVMTAKQKQRRPLVMINGRASGSESEAMSVPQVWRTSGSEAEAMSARSHKKSDSFAGATHTPISLARALA